MRISGGTARGTKIQVPPGARPASEKVRLAIFSSLGEERVAGARVLDAFCGSGAYGLEALSRGAATAVFVDSLPKAVALVRHNLAAAKFQAQVIRADAVNYATRKGAQFDLIFADPPYGDPGVGMKFLSKAARRLTDGGLAVLETKYSRAPAPDIQACILHDDRRYGDTRVLMYSKKGG